MEMKGFFIEIRKFLKRLETGQMELGAGQWELHKEISHLKTSVEGLEQLKFDFQRMKNYGLKQTNLIKKLQSKINILEEVRKKNGGDHWSSFSSNEKLTNCYTQCDIVPKKKVQSKSTMVNPEKDIEGQSQEFMSVSESFLKLKPEEINTSKDKKPLGKSKVKNTEQNFCKSSGNILNRYLKDSARYSKKALREIFEKRKSKTRASEFPSKSLSDVLKNELEVVTSGFLEKSKRKSSSQEKCNCILCTKKFKNIPSSDKIHNTKSLYTCDVCKKKFFCKINFKKHGKAHLKLKNLVKMNPISKRFRGFRCSYCDKICSSPEKLTEHLENCRIITRRNCPKK